MTESPTPSKFAKWKRPIIGGLFSSGISAFFMLLYTLAYRSNWLYDFLFSTLQIDTFGFGFYAPGLLLMFAGFEIWIPGGVMPIPTAILIFVWFLIGSIITHWVRKNIFAIGLWILFYIFCYFGVLYFMFLGMS